MDTMLATNSTEEQLSFEKFRQEVLLDYKIACISREVSLTGRREVLTGKAKFGIFGDGKELAQIAAAKFFKPGDWLSGYYRDQTMVLASGQVTVQQYFAQLYADPNENNDPHSAGRQMNAHFCTANANENGEWNDLANTKNIASNMAPTASQLPRSVGFAYASRAFRKIERLKKYTNLSNNGNEVCFCTIGDASTSEGHFWETVNAAGVLQVPLAIFVWDDGYGISVPKKYQTTKGSISELLKGFEKEDHTNGLNIYKLKGWDYAGMCEVLEHGIDYIRKTHTPAIFHIEELTQPQGHSTSGSHERYKTVERLQWEKDWDCIKKMKEWMLANELCNLNELEQLELETKEYVRAEKNKAWEAYILPIKDQQAKTLSLLNALANQISNGELEAQINELQNNKEPLRRDIMKALGTAVMLEPKNTQEINSYYSQLKEENKLLYNSHLYNQTPKAALNIKQVEPEYNEESKTLNGYEVLNKYFDSLFEANDKVIAFGEDLGFIGDVNQGFSGLQEKHGSERIFDTGIRELTIMGQGIGMAYRGLRPIAEIQYLDYLIYGLQPLSDDVSSLQFRTKGKQSAPIIVRTRGHRLEGIWHSGSPMSMILGSLRGMYVCVPRNMVQAAGMYNTLLAGNDPGLVIESLNGYRLKEKCPTNLLEMRVELGVPEIVKPGTDITIVSYGSTLRIAEAAAVFLETINISAEIIDVRTLLPFDKNNMIVESLKKTNRILFVDEDVPGGAAAYMYNKVMEEQGGYKWLDANPRTLTAQAHRPGYGSDGDYFGKPNMEDICRVVKEIIAE